MTHLRNQNDQIHTNRPSNASRSIDCGEFDRGEWSGGYGCGGGDVNKDDLIAEIKAKLDIGPYDKYADDYSRACQETRIDTYKSVVEVINSYFDEKDPGT